MTKIILSGRTDIESYFKQSGVFESERLDHTPLIVFIAESGAFRVSLVDNARKLLSMDDSTQVMGQWRGEWRSDFYQFSVGQYRHYIEANDEQLKSARNVIKAVGPHGGFRWLRYEIEDERGTAIPKCASGKQDAERLESLFRKYGTPIVVERQ